MNQTLFLTLSIGAYLCALAMLAPKFWPGLPRCLLSHRGSLLAAMAGLVTHALLLGEILLHPQGLDLGLFNALVLVAWLITALLLFSQFWKPAEPLLLALAYPGNILILLLQRIFHEHYLLTTTLSIGLKLHIVLSISAYSILSIATLQSLVLHMRHRSLRNKHRAQIYNILPSLETMDRLLIQFILAGFFLLSLSLTSGIVFIQDLMAQHLVHKTTLSSIAWGIYGILLWGHWQKGWRGVALTRYVLGAFVLLFLAYFGSKLALEMIFDKR